MRPLRWEHQLVWGSRVREAFIEEETFDSFIPLCIHSMHLGIHEALSPVEVTSAIPGPAHSSRARLRRVLYLARLREFNLHWVWPLLLDLGQCCQPLPWILTQLWKESLVPGEELERERQTKAWRDFQKGRTKTFTLTSCSNNHCY